MPVCPRDIERNSGIEPNISAFSVGGVSLHVAAGDCRDAALVPALLPFQVSPSAVASDIAVTVERVSKLALSGSKRKFDSGSVWQLYDSEVGLQFDFCTPFFGDAPYKRLLVDRKFRRAQLFLNDLALARTGDRVAPLDYPLDELLVVHRLTQEQAVELHGCGIVGPRGASNLFIGHSGAGKSTTAHLWTAHDGVEILSDDRIIVRRSPVQGGSGAILMYGTPWHGEGQFASPSSSPLSRICILEHGHGNVLTRLSSSQAVAELFARSFVPFHRHEYVESALAFLEELAREVPCYRFSFEPDQRAVETILNFND